MFQWLILPQPLPHFLFVDLPSYYSAVTLTPLTTEVQWRAFTSHRFTRHHNCNCLFNSIVRPKLIEPHTPRILNIERCLKKKTQTMFDTLNMPFIILSLKRHTFLQKRSFTDIEKKSILTSLFTNNYYTFYIIMPLQLWVYSKQKYVVV